ncbi:MAG: hypothetical protein ACM3QS_15355 [Bacteroidota bacterium]
MNKNTGLIATIATAFLCGCPALFLCIFGIAAATGNLPYSTEVNGVSQTGTVAPVMGATLLCLALLFILIPVVLGAITLFSRPAAPPPPPDEPLPPAS